MREPVVVDSTLHRAFTALYAIYVVTGILAAFSLPPSLETVGGTELTRFWILGLGVTSALSLWFSLNEKHERRELLTAILLVACLAIYSVAVLVNGFSTWNLDRLMVGTFSLSFLILPLWRVQWFFRKYRKVTRG